MIDSVTTTNPGMARDVKLRSSDMALVVNGDGSICSVMQPHGEAAVKESVSELWPGEVGQHVRSNVRRVLRDREFFCDFIERDDEGRSAEHIYIAQGRDRVLLIVRDTSRRQKDMSRLEKLAYVDNATGLPNRELFNDSLQKVCEHQRLREGRAAVICIHVDDVDDDQGRVSIDSPVAVAEK
mgnify:FL=1